MNKNVLQGAGVIILLCIVSILFLIDGFCLGAFDAFGLDDA
jgi:hypothetical protein